MSNTCGFGTMRRPTGWIAWYRLYHQAENRVLQHDRADIIFGTKDEAEAEAKAAFLKQMNSPIVSENMGGSIKEAKRATAEARLFKKGKVITVEHKSKARASG